jgi:prevent-host-death family protein
MRFVNVRELKSKTSEILRAAAGEDIIVTNHGKPVAVVAGIDGGDFEKIGFRGGASQGTSLRLATRPWLISTGEYGGSEPPGKARGPGRRQVSEARTPYRMEAVDHEKPEAGMPAPAPAEKAAWNPLKAVFWDYPELTEEKAVRAYVEEACRSPERGALDWVLTRFLERGRVIDVRKFFDWAEIRSALPHLRLTLFARNKWARMLEVYDRI